MAQSSFQIVAQDPSVKRNGRILRAIVEIPAEHLAPGPRGHRVSVVDYDASTHTLYAPAPGEPADWSRSSDRELVGNPQFHSQNVYAIVVRTLNRFEHALGRRVAWAFDAHQIKVAPHAFAAANAFYSRQNESLLFGYFPSRRRGLIFTALSHDIIVHETAHALLDGLRARYRDPSTPDQAAFHEGFADVVAMLSVFSLPEVVDASLPKRRPATGWGLRQRFLVALAEQFGRETAGRPLRSPAGLRPSKRYLQCRDFAAPHRRGQILVAAIANAFLATWEHRIAAIERDRVRVIEEGASIAERLLTMAIRALDYTPPTDITFSDYLSAIITADQQTHTSDERYGLRERLLACFRAFGIGPAPSAALLDGTWRGVGADLNYSDMRFEAMQRDPEEVFRFVWQNRQRLGLHEHAYTSVESVRPCVRIADDGFVLRETVAEYIQVLRIKAGELTCLLPEIRKPAGLRDSTPITLYGGGALIFGQDGRLKYHIHNALTNGTRQTARLSHLWRNGSFEPAEGIECGRHARMAAKWRIA